MNFVSFFRHPLLRLERGIKKYPLFIFWRLHLDMLAAKYIGLMLLMLNRGRVKNRCGKFTILAMERTIFNDDIAALEEYASSHAYGITFIHINAVLRRLLSKIMWPEEIDIQREFYQNLSAHKETAARISKILGNALNFFELLTGLHVKVFLSGNINYAQDYPWIAVMRSKRKLFVVLDKESIIYSPSNSIARHKNYNFKYDGDFALFYNERARETFIEAGVVTPKQTLVLGSPRVDRLTSLAKNAHSAGAKDKFILINSFSLPTKGAPLLFEEILETISSDARLSSRVLFKCKTQTEAEKLMKKFPALKGVWGPMDQYLKLRPALAVGFNSGSCLDALIAGIPLLVPLWSDAARIKKEDALLGEHTKNFHLVSYNKTSFVETLKNALSNNLVMSALTQKSWISDPAFRKFIEHYYSPIDGKNCERFFEFLRNQLP